VRVKELELVVRPLFLESRNILHKLMDTARQSLDPIWSKSERIFFERVTKYCTRRSITKLRNDWSVPVPEVIEIGDFIFVFLGVRYR
jgi:hypothetical protein